MEEKEDLDIKAEIDKIARKIDNILGNIEAAEGNRSENENEESQ
ncbi:MAG: hypothetical protein P8X55_21575 [Desulfosarcinaceae bacterium]